VGARRAARAKSAPQRRPKKPSRVLLFLSGRTPWDFDLSWRRFGASTPHAFAASCWGESDPAWPKSRAGKDVSYQSEWSKKQYAENPEFREKSRASCSAYQQSHKEEISAQRRRKRQEPETREKNRVRSRRWLLKTQYGMTLEDYDAMLARQGGVCKICRRKPKPEKILAVDHNHATKRVRDLLCNGCNSMLGHSGDDPDILMEGAHYLRVHRSHEEGGQQGDPFDFDFQDLRAAVGRSRPSRMKGGR
jgi:Recombination endonuclease VII